MEMMRILRFMRQKDLVLAESPFKADKSY